MRADVEPVLEGVEPGRSVFEGVRDENGPAVGEALYRVARGCAENEAPIDLFERVDFEAWNGPDWDLFRELHRDDVFVDMFGEKTDGIDAHVAACQSYQTAVPESKVLELSVRMAAGEKPGGRPPTPPGFAETMGSRDEIEVPDSGRVADELRWSDGAMERWSADT